MLHLSKLKENLRKISEIVLSVLFIDLSPLDFTHVSLLIRIISKIVNPSLGLVRDI